MNATPGADALLAAGLMRPEAYPHPVAAVRRVETHVSRVFIAGEYAYKVKKPLDLGFLDFSTLARRQFCCQEEIRLNRRLAPDIYLDVIPVTGTPAAPRLGGDGPVLDYAVRMRAFDADATLDREPDLKPAQADAIADRLARFHGEIAPAPADGEYGTPAAVHFPVAQNFRQIDGLAPPAAARPDLAALAAWSEAEYQRLTPLLAARKATGRVRECHGDLHLGNIAWVDGQPLIFDGIEFNPGLRFIDVMSEMAFLAMDLIHRQRSDLAWRLLNRWLEHTGDYAGLAVLRYYLVYRAMVRAKVAFIRAAQGDAACRAEALGYLALAGRLARPGHPRLVLMHGVSGSGKSWLSGRLLECLGAIRLRSDVERKRLFGLDALADSRSIPGGIYTPEASQRTFDHLLNLTGDLLAQGYPVIVDATFLKAAHRRPFLQLAQDRGRPCHLIAAQAAPDILRQRVSAREQRGDDASEAGLAVLENQLREQEPPGAEEAVTVVKVDTGAVVDWEGVMAALDS